VVTAGIMDHDSIAGGTEFLEAAHHGASVTCGVECRVSFAGTPFADALINNPDQRGVAYMALHGVPAGQRHGVQEAFGPLRAARDRRNRAMTERIRRLGSTFGLDLAYDRDVVPLSWAAEGGCVTERHILFGHGPEPHFLRGRGAPLSIFWSGASSCPSRGKSRSYLLDAAHPGYAYDVLMPQGPFSYRVFYIPATDECLPVREMLALSERAGAISAYVIGRVANLPSATRPPRSSRRFLDELVRLLGDMGFRDVTYMPTRNTDAQLARVRELRRRMGFLEICGEDINQPRQSFVTAKLSDPGFSHLVDSAWALIAHERLADADPDDGFFSSRSAARDPGIAQRAARFRPKRPRDEAVAA
jgi:hypothetical protein